ncbi:MAG: FAD-dependent oxidoreductase [Deltaproteobacteria bacterium]|nr:FAD-dependent oxidoreductase [Deltaproteobacteria bacterium]
MSLKVVIIGAVATGPKAGCRIKRLDPKAQVIMVDRDDIFAYSGCGIPYYVSGDVADLEGLKTTSFQMVRDAAFFEGAKGIQVMCGWEAVKIDRRAKEVLLEEVKGGAQQVLGYDKLVIATGSQPQIPPIPGADLAGIWPVANLHQAQAIKEALVQGRVGAAAVLGAGPTGLEMAEALADLWEVEVHLYEVAEQVLPGLLDREMASFVEHHARQKGLNLYLEARVDRFVGDPGDGVRAVLAGGVETAVEMVVLATGVRPSSRLASEAGLEVSQMGAIRVNEHLQTSDPDIYAGGDCVVNKNLITGQETYLASGSIANRQGRVIANNIVAGANRAVFPGVVGSWIMKFFDLAVGKVGLSTSKAVEAGFDPVGALVVQADRAHFYPDNQLMYLKLIADRKTRRILGVQCLGEGRDAVAARIDAVAAAMPFKPTVEEIANLELAYAPPFASAMDILNAAANTTANLIDGLLEDISPQEFSRTLNKEDPEVVFLDIRRPVQAEPFVETLGHKGWQNIPQETLATRLDEVPRSRPIFLVCNSGARSYEAQTTLRQAGVNQTYNLAGGMAAVKMSGEEVLKEKGEE